MSWIIRELLSSTLSIKNTMDLESDEFNNLLVLEKKIEDMKLKGLFSYRETKLLEFIPKGFTINEITELLNSNRMTVAKDIKKVCNKIAFQLGGEFTDDGYLEYVKEKYKLSSDDVTILRKFIHGRFSRKLARKGKDA